MNTTLAGMTLRELLKRYDIHTIRELTQRTGLSRQQCWNLWHGKVGVGLETVKLLHDRLQIPLEELVQIDPPEQPKHKGRKPRHE
jgi:transcriptional regulator with XRE-family HTH domain